MNTETVTVHQKGEDFEITVQHDQSGSAYGMPLSKNAYEQLRQHFVSGQLPTDEEIINEAEGRYPVKTHNNPDNSPYVGTQKTFIHGVRWALSFVQGNYR